MADPDDPNRTRVVGGYIYAMYWQINEPLAQGVNHVFVPDPPLPPGSFVVADTDNTRSVLNRALDPFKQFCLDGVWRAHGTPDAITDAVLAALREAGK